MTNTHVVSVVLFVSHHMSVRNRGLVVMIVVRSFACLFVCIVGLFVLGNPRLHV